MGAWGPEPWDNDDAADWFGDLFETVPIVDKVLEGLSDESGSVNVAAIWMCVVLCRVYVWDIDRMDETLEAAINAADRILAGEDEERLLELWDNEPSQIARIQGYRDELASRVAAD
jgi:Domain of unknown function (DUF4259)